MKNSKRGFTLVEMILVIAVIVALSAVALIGVSASINHYNAKVDSLIDEGSYFEVDAMGHMRRYFSENRTKPTATPMPEAPYAPTATPSPEELSATPTAPVVGGTTNTPTPQPTNTPRPTNTPKPTNTPAPTTRPTGGNTINGGTANSYGGANHYSSSSAPTISHSEPIQRAVITLPDGVTVTQAQTEWMYRVDVNGNVITITYNGGNNSWDAPQSSLPISNLTWQTSDSVDGSDISYTVSYG